MPTRTFLPPEMEIDTLGPNMLTGPFTVLVALGTDFPDPTQIYNHETQPFQNTKRRRYEKQLIHQENMPI